MKHYLILDGRQIKEQQTDGYLVWDIDANFYRGWTKNHTMKIKLVEVKFLNEVVGLSIAYSNVNALITCDIPTRNQYNTNNDVLLGIQNCNVDNDYILCHQIMNNHIELYTDRLYRMKIKMSYINAANAYADMSFTPNELNHVMFVFEIEYMTEP